MPYDVSKVKGGYKVRNKKTGKTYSKKPMSKEKAKDQMAAIYANTEESVPLFARLVEGPISDEEFERINHAIAHPYDWYGAASHLGDTEGKRSFLNRVGHEKFTTLMSRDELREQGFNEDQIDYLFRAAWLVSEKGMAVDEIEDYLGHGMVDKAVLRDTLTDMESENPLSYAERPDLFP